ncbi:hypothetical protein RJT34_13533 [Clitoria ternatea]|uniref:Uncharacterized protein n=1 Tax=Clitoria ternatea TaxID=43366 RepID=A0AAN9JNQ0_CLITE
MHCNFESILLSFDQVTLFSCCHYEVILPLMFLWNFVTCDSRMKIFYLVLNQYFSSRMELEAYRVEALSGLCVMFSQLFRLFWSKLHLMARVNPHGQNAVIILKLGSSFPLSFSFISHCTSHSNPEDRNTSGYDTGCMEDCHKVWVHLLAQMAKILEAIPKLKDAF